ncbi:homeobox-leucine zipper protein HAT4 [Salvia hispanica]|uniref:homeobox-leucine zipper protein HAT4 n=1 Tax=Salvia hispanica TaxID=49212 RepID=UPI002009BDE8|nr:homeobox-leucine zipper protein HAT4 [Salvia hispanica]
MMVQKDQELGLSLSLSYPAQKRPVVSTATPLHLNLMPSSSSPSPFTINTNNNCWTQAFTSSDRRGEETRSFLKGIDVNCLPETAEEAAAEEEEGGVSSPNSTISSLSGKRSEREDHDGFSRGISDEEDAENARKKLRLSKDQSAVLEESFKEHSTLNPKQKMALAKRLGLRPRQVEVWFQNRRARTKLKQTEVDCEFLKRCCENLTEENRRLQKEVQELRALKLSPQLYMQMTPPTTLTMCPSCERVALPSAADPVAVAQPRPIPFNPWPAAPRCRPFDAMQSRS